jgi:shikimate dehydrogenase
MLRTIATDLTKDTTLCISLAGRPGNTGTRFHNHLYDALGLDYVYKAFTTTDIAAAVAGVRGLGIRGCAVSMPWKSDVIPLVDEIDASAAAIDSVNTIVNTDGRLTAYNTDYIAIAKLVDRYEVPRSSVAVLGSGGMAKATVAALRDSGFTDLTVVARNAETGPGLAGKYGFDWAPALDGLRPALLVNCTPVGMEGGNEHEIPAPDEVIAATDVVFDVVPRPARTLLIQRAERLGKVTITGAEVMSLQALEQFVLYTGVVPSDEQVAAATAFSRYE